MPTHALISVAIPPIIPCSILQVQLDPSCNTAAAAEETLGLGEGDTGWSAKQNLCSRTINRGHQAGLRSAV